MAYVALGVLVLVVLGLAWVSARRRQRAAGCCAPADPRDDLRMRAAYEDDAGEPGSRPRH
jgi:hypothetical protein